jgi:hypothetical protein
MLFQESEVAEVAGFGLLTHVARLTEPLQVFLHTRPEEKVFESQPHPFSKDRRYHQSGHAEAGAIVGIQEV